MHPRWLNSARNLTFLSGADISTRFAELRLGLETLRSDLGSLRAELGDLRRHGSYQDAQLGALSTRVDDMAARVRGLSSRLDGGYYQRPHRPTAAEYWTGHNVTSHYRFASVEDSLQQLEFRNQQYPGYIDLLPVTGKDGMAILDYGCGPGHDLVGFAHYSRPTRLVGVDISASSLAEAEARMRLHGARAELVRIDHELYRLPFEAASFDYIHCSGVLMCIENPARLLREFARLLRPGGELRLMVYNYDSIWLHLYVAFVVQIENGLYSDLPARVAFTRTTDGEDCPVNAVWQPDEMMALGRDAGFEPEFLGAAISLWELHVLPRRHIACLSQSLVPESRAFLMNLRLDSQGIPWYGRQRAGVDGCYRLRRRR